MAFYGKALIKERDEKQKALEKIEPESAAAPWLRLGGAAASTVAGAVVGGRLARKAKDPRVTAGLGKFMGAYGGAIVGGLAGATHAAVNKDKADSRALVDAKERRDKALAAAGMTNEQAKSGPKGSATERTTRARNVGAGVAAGAAVGAGLGYRFGRRKAAPAMKAVRNFTKELRAATSRGSVDPFQAMHGREQATQARAMTKAMAPAGAGVGAFIGGTVGLAAGDSVGRARQTKRQDGRDAARQFERDRADILDYREKAAGFDSMARSVRKHWPKARRAMTSGPVAGAAIVGGVGAAAGGLTADEGKGFRDAAIGGAAGALVGGAIGHKYKRVPVKRGKGVRVVSEAEAAAMEAKGFFEPPIGAGRRLPRG